MDEDNQKGLRKWDKRVRELEKNKLSKRWKERMNKSLYPKLLKNVAELYLILYNHRKIGLRRTQTVNVAIFFVHGWVLATKSES